MKSIYDSQKHYRTPCCREFKEYFEIVLDFCRLQSDVGCTNDKQRLSSGLSDAL